MLQNKFIKRYANSYEEKFKTLLKDSKVDLHKWEGIPYLWVR